MNDIVVTMNKENESIMKISFTRLPQNLVDLQSLPEDNFKTPEYACALFVALMTNYERDPEETMKMLDYINGPNDISVMDKQFYKDRMVGKNYKAFSFFEGATPDNEYTPNTPYTTYVKSNMYTDTNPGYKTFWMTSGGADNDRQITVRLKNSNLYWYLNTNGLLSDIKIPASQDKWN